MPCLRYLIRPFDHDSGQSAQGGGVKPDACRKAHIGYHPEFRFATAFANMNMHRFPRAALVGLEEEPEPVMPENRWHSGRIIHPFVSVTCPILFTNGA